MTRVLGTGTTAAMCIQSIAIGKTLTTATTANSILAEADAVHAVTATTPPPNPQMIPQSKRRRLPPRTQQKSGQCCTPTTKAEMVSCSGTFIMEIIQMISASMPSEKTSSGMHRVRHFGKSPYIFPGSLSFGAYNMIIVNVLSDSPDDRDGRQIQTIPTGTAIGEWYVVAPFCH